MNGIVINDDFHEAIRESVSNVSCRSCSLYDRCAETNYSICFADLFRCDSFVNRGKATVRFSRETPENTGSIYRNGVKIEKEK
ncbi:hypothetical protein [Bacteroides clarus]|uniref:hypothetical protein n=1 Tax=Bacteroides clarus TaxID=626929 RepID=UPI001178A075|nr:hypothetical protein [Bacteroides clarus]